MFSVSAMLWGFRRTRSETTANTTKFCDRETEENLRRRVAFAEDCQQVDEKSLDRAVRGYLREIKPNSKQFAFINSHLSFYALMQTEEFGIEHAGWDRHHGVLRPVFKFKQQA